MEDPKCKTFWGVAIEQTFNAIHIIMMYFVLNIFIFLNLKLL